MIHIDKKMVKDFWNAYVEGVKQAVAEEKFGYIVLNVKNNRFYFTTNAHFNNEFPVIPVDYCNAKRVIPADVKKNVPLPEEYYSEVRNYLEHALSMLEG